MKRSELKRRRKPKPMLASEYEAQLVRLWRKQDGLCGVCGRRLSRQSFPPPQVAHILPNTLANIAAYGKAVIDHDDNKVLVDSLECNNKAQRQPGSQPVFVAEHVARIRAAIEEGTL